MHEKNAYKPLFIFNEDVIYLNCANMAPMLHSVKEAGIQALEKKASPWKFTNAVWFNQTETLRAFAAKIFCTNPGNIALIPSASYGLALAAKNIAPQRGKKIILLEGQFPSNFYVWQEMSERTGMPLVTISKNENKTFTESLLEAIDDNTAIVSIPNCHWMNGEYIHVQVISDAVKKVSAVLVLDLSQSLGALPTDIEKIDPDFAISVGYKWLMGAYGLGYMYISPRWHDKGEPLEYSWLTRKGSEDSAALTEYNREFKDGARKFDMGENTQFHLLPIAIAGLQQVLEWTVDHIQHTIQPFSQAINEFKKSKGWANSKEKTLTHISGIPLNKDQREKVKTRFGENKIIISYRGPMVRVSPHLYNDMNDIKKLLSCFE